MLDDATSALDLRTEAQLHEALTTAKPNATKIIVAQRIATAMLADRIVMMEAGRIADIGTHAELLSRCELYQTVYDSQLGESAGASPATGGEPAPTSTPAPAPATESEVRHG